MSSEPARHFDRTLIQDLEEPVQRYFVHAISDGAPLGVRSLVAARWGKARHSELVVRHVS
jgi:hypothetical protein